MLMPAGMTILTRAAGPQRVGRVMAIIGVPMLLGPILGPILGGWLVDDVSLALDLLHQPADRHRRARARAADPPARQAAARRALRRARPRAALAGPRADDLRPRRSRPRPAASARPRSGARRSSASRCSSASCGTRCARRTPLIDLRLFDNRTFAAASGTLMLMIISVFGAMLLLPLYLQAVRGESAFDSGLLLAPQGIGAMLVMPIAGQLDRQDRRRQDRHPGPGHPRPLDARAHAARRATRPTGRSARVLFAMGVGMGFSMMPLMSGAMQTLRRAAGRARLDDAEHHPAGRRLDRHRGHVRDPHRGAAPTASARAPAAASAPARRTCRSRSAT